MGPLPLCPSAAWSFRCAGAQVCGGRGEQRTLLDENATGGFSANTEASQGAAVHDVGIAQGLERGLVVRLGLGPIFDLDHEVVQHHGSGATEQLASSSSEQAQRRRDAGDRSLFRSF